MRTPDGRRPPHRTARSAEQSGSGRASCGRGGEDLAGPRMSEIRGLRVGDVDFDAGLLRFVQGYTDDGGFASVKGYEVRSVPMAPSLAARLKPYCAGRPADALVFHPERGADAMSGSTTYATRSARRRSSGSTSTKVQRWLGHKSITTTEKYLHYAPTRTRQRRWTNCGAARRRSSRCPNLPPTIAKLPPRMLACGSSPEPVWGQVGGMSVSGIGSDARKAPVSGAFLVPEEGLEPPTRGL
jgi:hypothetical protein